MLKKPPLRHHPDRRPPTKRVFVQLALVGLALALSGCGGNRLGMPNPGTKEADDVLRLWQVTFYAAAILGVLVFGLIFYTLIRHRRRNDELPKQHDGSVMLEVIYTVIPFIIVSVLFVYGVKVQAVETKVTKNPAVTVDVTGFQWNWRFHYPQSDVTVVGDNSDLPVLTLPMDERVRLNLVAADVAHSFFVPGFLTKRDLIPGVHNTIELTPKREGFFIGHCAEYCGLNHSQMNFQVHVVTPADYNTWMQQQKAQVATS